MSLSADNEVLQVIAMNEVSLSPSAAADPDVQEALSRKYSDQVVIFLRLRSNRLAVFNNLREFCGVVDTFDEWEKAWRLPPRPMPTQRAIAKVDLDELGL